MKNLRDILGGTESFECSDADLEETITEAVGSEESPNSEVEVEKPASADKVTLAMANLSDMVTMADEIYYTLSEMEEIEEDMVNDIKSAFVSLDEIYKEVDEKYDIATPEMGPDTVEEAEELIGQDIDDILNEEAKTIQMKNLEDLKGKKEILTAMYGAMRKMRKADLQASYGYIKSSHCSSHDATEMMGKRDDILLGMMKDLKAMKMADLKDSYGYMKASYGHDESMEMDQEDEMISASHCMTKDEDLEEMKTKDDDLAVFVYDFIGADTEGTPLKTLIMQAVGKYFGSQKNKGEETEER